MKSLSNNNKALMLKDFLVDDLSSCSSSGFRSYPRRQCCTGTTTVRFLLDIDLIKNKPIITKHNKKVKKKKPEPGNAGGGGSISAFQRASVAIIKAVKHLPFASSPPSKHKFGGILSRSFSKKLLNKRGFSWKKENDHYKKEIQMWRPVIHNHLFTDDEEEKYCNPSPPPPPQLSAASGGTSSDSSTSESSTNNSWSESDFGTTSDQDSLLHGSNKIVLEKKEEENDKNVLPVDGVFSSSSSKRVGGADNPTDVKQPTTHNSCTNSISPPNPTKGWPNEEKEQLSPVSVLDCPFEDDDEDNEVSSSSPFQHRLTPVEGTKNRLMKKIKRFELLSQLEPINLVKRMSSSSSSESNQESNQEDEETETTAAEHEQEQQKTFEFLKFFEKSTLKSPLSPDLEKLLLDFFKLGYPDMTNRREEEEEKLVAIARDWINGKSYIINEQMILEWKVNKKNREMYIQDMERNGGEWRKKMNDKSNLDTKEKTEVALEIELEIFGSLINDLLDDLIYSSNL